MLTRTLYQEPEHWVPMCGIQGTDTPPLPLTEEQCADTGTRRRLNYARMPREFPIEDKLLKGCVNSGKCTPTAVPLQAPDAIRRHVRQAH